MNDFTNVRLIDGLDLNDNIITRYGIKITKLLDTYYYLDSEKCYKYDESTGCIIENGNQLYKKYDVTLYEHLTLQELSDFKCREKIMNDLTAEREAYKQDVTPDDRVLAELGIEDEGLDNSVYFVGKGVKLIALLLILRIDQLQDSTAFYVLSKFLEAESKEFFEGYGMVFNGFCEFFLKNMEFLIQQSVKYQDVKLIDSLRHNFPTDILSEYEFMRKSNINTFKIFLEKGLFFISPELFIEFKDQNFKNELTRQLEIITNSNVWRQAKHSDSEFEQVLMHFVSVDKYVSKLTEQERLFYDKHIYPLFERSIVHNYHVSARDGYTNLRSEPNIDAEILTTVSNGEYVCFLPDLYSDDVEHNKDGWIKVAYPQFDDKGFYNKTFKGYIHSSQLEGR